MLRKMTTLFLILIFFLFFALDMLHYIPHRKYASEHFGIEDFKSSHDEDEDGIDDQTDILQSVRAYLATKPKYKSQYYDSGYPDDQYGVCTDVVAQGMVGAGYDIQELVDQDIRKNPEDYDIERPDRKIDFRRVVNLKVYFEHTAICLTRDTNELEEWQGGDIVLWDHHVGVISDKRNNKGLPYVLHHANPWQASYEQDVLDSYGEILGHYRISE